MRLSRRCVAWIAYCPCFVASLLLLAHAATAQTTNASLTGRVLDQSNGAIPHAKVLVVNQDTGVQYHGETNNDGIYSIPDLPPATYRIEVTRLNFKTIIKPDVQLHVQDAIAINFTLPVGSASESVTVSAGAPIVNTESPAVSTVLDRNFVESIPLNGRSLQPILSQLPVTPTWPRLDHLSSKMQPCDRGRPERFQVQELR
jgi:Carboxypeptidase regulatory-like domain